MEFSIKRLSYLFKIDFKRILGKNTLKILAVIMLVFSIIDIINILLGDNYDRSIMYNQFIAFFLISSVIVGTLVFMETKEGPERVSFLSLPASHFEKIVSKFIVSMIVYPVCMFALYGLSWLMVNVIIKAFSSRDMNIDFINSHTEVPMYLIVLIGLIGLSIFAYGSIRYNNASFVKIIMRIAVIIGIALSIAFISGLILIPSFRYEVFGIDYVRPSLGNHNGINDSHWFPRLATFSFKYLLIPVFWVMSYFTLVEKEV